MFAAGRKKAVTGEMPPELTLIRTPITPVKVNRVRTAVQIGRYGLSCLLSFCRVNKFQILNSFQLFERHAEHVSHTLIGLNDCSIQSDQKNRDAGRVHDLLEHVFAQSQRFEQIVEAADQGADFILTADGHGGRCCVELGLRRK